MKTKEFVSLEKRLLPNFPGFAIKGSLMFIPPVQHTLRGFDFDPSGFSKDKFYINAFYLPLCIPQKRVSFTFGKCVKGTGWHADAPNLEAELIPAMKNEMQFLSSLRTPKEILEAIKLRAPDSKNPYHREAMAYLLARIGEIKEATAALNHLLELLDLAVSWQRDMANRAENLKAKLLSNPVDAQRQLDAWEDESVRGGVPLKRAIANPLEPTVHRLRHAMVRAVLGGNILGLALKFCAQR